MADSLTSNQNTHMICLKLFKQPRTFLNSRDGIIICSRAPDEQLTTVITMSRP